MRLKCISTLVAPSAWSCAFRQMRLPTYKRPYCKTCRTIWGAQSIGRVFICQYNHTLILKSFNPWLRTLYACGFLAGGIATMAIPHMPVFWIGGILFAPIYAFNGFRQWFHIRKLDGGSTVSRTLSVTAKCRHLFGAIRRVARSRTFASRVLSCRGCGQQLRVPNLNRVVRVTCPRCKRQTVITRV